MFKLINRFSTRVQIFIVILMLSLFLSFLGAFGSYILRIKQVRENLIELINENFTSAESLLLTDINNIKKMLLITAEMSSGKNIKNDNDLEFIRSYILIMTKTYGSIMQFRVIDIDGDELIRVEREEKGKDITNIEKNSLQNKKERYYFSESLHAKKGEIYISDLDLNMENKKIELPLKPTLRFSTPIFKDGSKTGIVIINYFAQNILNHFKSIKHMDIYLADSKGYYISHPNEDLQFAKDMKIEANIFNDFKFMDTVRDTGVFCDYKGMVARKVLLSEGHYFYVVYHINDKYMSSIHIQQIVLSMILYVIAAVLSFILSFYISKYPSEQYDGKILEIDRMKSFTKSMRAKMGELEDSSYLDPLTGIFNRRYFDEKIKDYTDAKIIYGIIMIDIDHFKNINDNFGHDTGDRVLKMLAGLFCKNIRDTDFLTRWGGEEFCLTVRGVDENIIVEIAEKLRRYCEKFDFGISRTITCSFGVSIRNDDEDVDTVFKRADTALYQAKRDGRNRVIFA